MKLCKDCCQDLINGGRCDLPEDYRELQYRKTGSCRLFYPKEMRKV
jgi:hypothetical protein